MNKKEIDKLWNRAIREAMDEGCLYTRYHFAELVAAAEREACAKVCEEIENDQWALYKGRPPYKGDEDGRADTHVHGVSDGAGMCAAAIRARGQA